MLEIFQEINISLNPFSFLLNTTDLYVADKLTIIEMRGYLKEVKGGTGGHQVTKEVLGGANELPWSRCFQIGATLDALVTFKKSGGLRGYLKEV